MVTEQQVRDSLREVIDPEIGVNIVDLGLVYDIYVKEKAVMVVLTVTTPLCPLGSYLTQAVETRLLALPEVESVEVHTVYEPPWNPSMMSDEARRSLGWVG
ncbi:hypothetical protein BMS3Abin02_01565 [bacterium BMS3Abin02]|nr:hypothetical protein BMS3Abin02_01565 [bacterium BMS3Abin02]GBE23649.1 hypothetical protein BMS3Bbin01_03034 [bacterium BMS3Bbin01]HDL49553.1 metal-sulfur cluster assembly factor [Actinomycetota bacterium]